LKIEEIRELRRKSTIEDIVGEVKVTKRNERGERRGNWAREFVVGERKVSEKREIGNVVGKCSGESERREVDGDDVAVLATCYAVPGTVWCFWVP
jgi:hypothetical protein